ncbi:DUF3558 domain-containing protein [Amycolatopsis sp. AA4]|uniref:DUF3558 domain-containing protein n=1 Tax=Actinomycetes TaxID=1760 RepID=UPI0009973370|nr:MULTISPECIES: DUF3558 domain-containing protein [Actinomycetes]ATY16134.1 DUF3558 domain-containing protein [Amycolatopsis sp. AA4]
MFAAGCSGGSTPAPPAGSGPSSAQSSAPEKTLPYGGAPKVERPLPASVLSTHPCDSALTPDQVASLLGRARQGMHKDDPSLGAECQWSNDETGALATVLYATKLSDGLSAVYANSKPQATLWRELPPVRGFPAVAHSTFKQESVVKSFCQVSVGVSDQTTVDASVSLGDSQTGKKDPCGAAATVADMVVTNLKQKAGE